MEKEEHQNLVMNTENARPYSAPPAEKLPWEKAVFHQAKEPEKKESVVKETIRFVFLSLLIVLPFRYFIAQPFVVSGASMDPTFKNGQYLIVDQLSYRFEEPQRGEVIIFRYPRDPSKFFIKRIVGLPFETVEFRDGQIYITPASSTKPFKLEERYLKNDAAADRGKMILRGSEYFVMGDNRTESSDSRAWGPLQRRLIVGTPLLRLLPFSAISYQPGMDEVVAQ